MNYYDNKIIMRLNIIVGLILVIIIISSVIIMNTSLNSIERVESLESKFTKDIAEVSKLRTNLDTFRNDVLELENLKIEIEELSTQEGIDPDVLSGYQLKVSLLKLKMDSLKDCFIEKEGEE